MVKSGCDVNEIRFPAWRSGSHHTFITNRVSIFYFLCLRWRMQDTFLDWLTQPIFSNVLWPFFSSVGCDPAWMPSDSARRTSLRGSDMQDGRWLLAASMLPRWHTVLLSNSARTSRPRAHREPDRRTLVSAYIGRYTALLAWSVSAYIIDPALQQGPRLPSTYTKIMSGNGSFAQIRVLITRYLM